MKAKKLLLGEMAHAMASAIIIGTAVLDTANSSPNQQAREYFDKMADDMVRTNVEAVTALQLELLRDNGKLAKHLYNVLLNAVSS